MRNGLVLAAAIAIVSIIAIGQTVSYQRYNDGCQSCHGAFDSATSTKGALFPSGDKHVMHVSTIAMNTECDLCHTSGDNRNPFMGSSNGTNNNAGLGCTGCHRAPGLRAHHQRNSVECATPCHTNDPTPQRENVNPPYYGTADTEVNDACNPAASFNVNENWTLIDFIGTDNDGDGLYDQDDPDCQASAETPGEAQQLLVLGHDKINEILDLGYDNTTCAATSNNLYFGPLSMVSTLSYSGQECLIGNSGSHGFDYTGIAESVFFLVVANDTVTEGSYGLGSGSERMSAGLCPQSQDLMARCDASP